MAKVFIDGSAGTTGLRIYERLAERNDIELLILSEENRKDPAARKAALNEADIAFLARKNKNAAKSYFVECNFLILIFYQTNRTPLIFEN